MIFGEKQIIQQKEKFLMKMKKLLIKLMVNGLMKLMLLKKKVKKKYNQLKKLMILKIEKNNIVLHHGV